MRRRRRTILRGVWLALGDADVRALLGLTLSLTVGAAFFYHWVEGWRLLDAAYFAVVTMATVGYGDFAPKTDAGKLFTIAYLFCGIGLFVATVTALAERILAQRDREP
jgi:hypothetical protein